MLLAIEQGNTNTLFAVHDGERWTAQWRAATHANRTADEYAVWLSQLLAMAGLQQIGRAHVWTPVTHAHIVCRLLLEKKKYRKPRTQNKQQPERKQNAQTRY